MFLLKNKLFELPCERQRTRNKMAAKFKSFAEFQSYAASKPRPKKVSQKRAVVPANHEETGENFDRNKTAAGDDISQWLVNKEKKELWLAEKAEIDTQTKRVEHAELIGRLVRSDVAQKMLEQEHLNWLTAIDEWRQIINKKIGKLGLPVEMQESINDMVGKEITIMRQKRAVMEVK
jgi:hypothetical protein